MLICLFIITPVITYSQISVTSGTYFINTGNIKLIDLGIKSDGTFNSTSGTIEFTGSANSTLGGTGTVTFNNLTINKSVNTLGLIMNNNITINGTLTLSVGDLYVYNKTLTLGSSANISGESNNNWIKSTATSNKGTVTTTRNLTGPISGYTFGNIGISVTSTATLGSTSGTRKFDAFTIGSNTGIAKSFTVIPTNNSGLNATFVFNYFGNEITAGLDPNNMILHQSTNNGTSFIQITAINSWNSGTQSGTLTANGLATFGANNVWTSSDINHPLPIVLESFTSTVNVRDVNLYWITSEENNNAGFEIQKSKSKSQKTEWYKVGYVLGQGTKHTLIKYTFKESKLNSGRYNYRLKQVDYNGNFKYYVLNDIVEIAPPKEYKLSQNYPNPFNPSTKIDFELPVDCRVTLTVYDIAGREIAVLLNNDLRTADYYTIDFNDSNIASGVYFYRLVADKFVQVKKMILLK